MVRKLGMLVLALAAALAAGTTSASADQPPAPPPSITICHQPGTPAEKTLTLPKPAADAQVRVGIATLGACGAPPPPPGACSQPPTPTVPAATDQPVEEDEWISGSTATLQGVSETALNPAGAQVRWTLSCPTLATDASSVVVYANGRPIAPEAVTLTPDSVTVTTGLGQGRTNLELLGTDTYGFTIDATATVWAGSYSVPVVVLDQAGQAVGGATVVAHLADDPAVQETVLTNSLGQAQLTNLPNRTFNLTASASGNRIATLPMTVFDGTAVLRLKGFEAASTIDNNDFHLGTADGWNVGTAPVWIVPHQEESPFGFAPVAAAPTASAPVATAPVSGAGGDRAAKAKGHGPAQQAPLAPAIASTAAPDLDLELGTSGEGQQSISRTLDVPTGVKSVTVRYRFITSEVPGGYFGTQYNDYYNVSVRSQKAGGAVTDGNSMNAMGLGAFDGGGATGWFESELPVDATGDTVQVDVAVANVADGYLDSQVVVDVVKETKLSISQLKLNDIDNTALNFLSASSHTYFGGNTRVNGTITLKGAKDDTLKELKLEVLQNGGVIATGTLASALTSTLYRQFGDTEQIQLASPQLLFEIPASQLAGVEQATNGTLSLRVKATSQNGEEAQKDAGTVTKLVQFTGGSRYGGRDTAVGGDDWAKPQVASFVNDAGLTWGDFSNMNGGPFAPHHLHQTGNSADGWFSGFNNRDAAAAATIVGHLNAYGTRITSVFVTFGPASTFAKALVGVVLNDGRRADQVIRNVGGHTTHFHWEMTDN